MNAIYIIDEEYPSFQSAWVDVQKLLDVTGSSKTTQIEPLRLTFSDSTGESWVQALEKKPDEIGWHFASIPTDEFLNAIRLQGNELVSKAIRFRVMAHPTGKAQIIELRFDPPGPAYVAIPFEDDVKNTGRFFGRLIPAFQKAYGWSSAQTKAHVAQLHEHCRNTSPTEKPLELRSSSLFSFLRSSPTKNVWLPKYGTVGRHSIFQELRIEQDPVNLAWLSKLLSEIESVGRSEPPQLYFQFFSPFSSQPKILMQASQLFETTFTFNSLSYSEGQKLFETLEKESQASSGVKDSFSLFDQKVSKIGETCSATYMIRRAANKMFEIRVNTTWEGNNIDPEQAVVSVEKMSGLPWAQIA